MEVGISFLLYGRVRTNMGIVGIILAHAVRGVKMRAN
jgi:hypothetical protein